MIMNLASTIVSFLEKHGAVNSKFREVYVYGCDIALYTAFSTAGLLLIGAMAGRLWQTVILISIFYINQSVGGGFHASTHMRCFLTMVIGLLLFVASCTISMDRVTVGCIGLGSVIVLYLFPLILHKNKRHLISRSAALIRRSRITVIAQAVLLCVCLMADVAFAQAVALSMLLSAASRCVAVSLQKTKSFT